MKINPAIVFLTVLITVVFTARGQSPVPNYVQSEVVIHPDSFPSKTIDYSDAVGRSLQTSLELAADTARISATVYDSTGRPWKTTVPFSAASMDHVSDPLAAAAADPGRQNQGNVFGELKYKPDPLGRVDVSGLPGGAEFSVSRAHCSRTWYLGTSITGTDGANVDKYGLIYDGGLGVSQLDAVEAAGVVSNPTHFLIVTKDPDDNYSQEIKDIFGRTVSTCAMSGIRAEYSHDILGNVLKESPPHSNPLQSYSRMVDDNKATTYQYATAGYLLSKTSVDAGVVNYKYDPAGRLKASQNARQFATGADASKTPSWLSEVLTHHPTTMRENRSIKTVRYSQPQRLGRYVISLTSTWLGALTVKLRFSRFCATGKSCFESVVTRNLRLAL